MVRVGVGVGVGVGLGLGCGLGLGLWLGFGCGLGLGLGLVLGFRVYTLFMPRFKQRSYISHANEQGWYSLCMPRFISNDPT